MYCFLHVQEPWMYWTIALDHISLNWMVLTKFGWQHLAFLILLWFTFHSRRSYRTCRPLTARLKVFTDSSFSIQLKGLSQETEMRYDLYGWIATVISGRRSSDSFKSSEMPCFFFKSSTKALQRYCRKVALLCSNEWPIPLGCQVPSSSISRVYSITVANSQIFLGCRQPPQMA
jgi:hypothetical protein